jgi:hypothetical protein
LRFSQIAIGIVIPIMHRPVCDLHRFPRLARHDDDSVLCGVRRHPTIMTGDKGAASHLVQPFPHYSLAACKSMLAALHLSEAQQANLATWFATHSAVAIEDVYVTMVRLATRFGEPLMRTHHATCPLEDLFDVEGRSYIDTANAVATTVACRRLDFFFETYAASPATKQLLTCMLKATPQHPLHLTATEIQQLNALYIAFLLHPHWFAEWCSPSVYYAALASGAPGTRATKRKAGGGGGDGAPHAPSGPGGNGHGDGASHAPSSSSGSSESFEQPHSRPRLNGSTPPGQAAPPPPSAPTPVVITYPPYTINMKTMGSHLQKYLCTMLTDRETIAFLHAACCRTGYPGSMWDQRVVRAPQDWNGWLATGRHGRPMHITLGQSNQYPYPNPLVIPSYVRKCEVSTSTPMPITFADNSHLKELWFWSRYTWPGLVIPRTVQDLTVGEFTEPFKFAPIIEDDGSQLRTFQTGYTFNQPLRLPASVKQIVLGHAFNSELDFEGPVALDELVLGQLYNRPGFHINGTVKRLVLGGSYNQADFVVPRATEYLRLGHAFNQPLQFAWETVVTHRAISSLDDDDDDQEECKDQPSSFYAAASSSTADVTAKPKRLGLTFHNQAHKNNPGLFKKSFGICQHISASSLPSSTRMASSLTYLHTGTSFNRPVQLPCTLETIEFGVQFNSTFEFESTPHHLTTLKFGRDFNLPCPSLPGSLETLEFGRDFNQAFAFETPPTLHSLTLGTRFERPGLQIPPNTRHVVMGEFYDQADFTIPVGVQTCVLSERQRHPITFQQPSSLQELTLPPGYDAPGLVVPRSVKRLTLGSYFNQPFAFEPGSQLQHFGMGTTFDQDICLPRSVVWVQENIMFKHRVSFDGPVALEHYQMGSSFNQPGFSIPGTVQTFVMGDEYNQPDFQIPEGTIDFIMGSDFNQPLHVPASVQKFTMNEYCFNSTLTFAPDCQVTHLDMGQAFAPAFFIVPASVTYFTKRSGMQQVVYAPRAHAIEVVESRY